MIVLIYTFLLHPVDSYVIHSSLIPGISRSAEAGRSSMAPARPRATATDRGPGGSAQPRQTTRWFSRLWGGDESHHSGCGNPHDARRGSRLWGCAAVVWRVHLMPATSTMQLEPNCDVVHLPHLLLLRPTSSFLGLVIVPQATPISITSLLAMI